MIEVAVAIIGVIVSVAASYFLGGRNAKAKMDANQSKAELETFKDSRHAQDEIHHSSDDDITRWLRERSGK